MGASDFILMWAPNFDLEDGIFLQNSDIRLPNHTASRCVKYCLHRVLWTKILKSWFCTCNKGHISSLHYEIFVSYKVWCL